MTRPLIRRVAFDIGSLTTKMITADIDPETNTVVKIIAKDTRKTEYKHDLEKSSNYGNFSREMIEKGIQALKELKNECENLQPQPQEYAAVATAAFRTAKNSAAIIEKSLKELCIPITIISQAEEAQLGFYGALARTGSDKSKSIVWDVGGGSMQITTLDAQGKILFYGNTFGFIRFTRDVITNIEHKDIAKTHSPNPMNRLNITDALSYAAHLATAIPDFITHKCAQPGAIIIGIGAVYYATHEKKEQISTIKKYTQSDILDLLEKKAGRTDLMLTKETHPAIPTTVSVTGLTLILGFMKQLCIESLTIAEVNLTDGLLVSPTYYNDYALKKN